MILPWRIGVTVGIFGIVCMIISGIIIDNHVYISSIGMVVGGFMSGISLGTEIEEYQRDD